MTELGFLIGYPSINLSFHIETVCIGTIYDRQVVSIKKNDIVSIWPEKPHVFKTKRAKEQNRAGY